jgi:hypothetical protein
VDIRSALLGLSKRGESGEARRKEFWWKNLKEKRLLGTRNRRRRNNIKIGLQ